MRVDLNADLGEGLETDVELLRWVTSANIACGAHAGDAETMRRTLVAAHEAGVSCGAHPGFADREHFGRRELPVTPADAYDLVATQLATLGRLADSLGIRLTHVKAHGALYNMAARDAALAAAIANAVAATDRRLALFGLSGAAQLSAAERAGLTSVSECFADRNYSSDGALVPRSHADALVTDPKRAAARVLRMLRDGVVRSIDGAEVPVKADTVCIHGDGPHAVDFARALRHALREAGVTVRAPAA